MEFAREPFAPKRIIVNRSLIASYLVNFFGIASAFTMIFHLSLYLQAVRGVSASQAGLWLILSVIGGLSGSLCGGLIIQATGKFYLITVLGYVGLLLGGLTITLSSGILLVSTAGIAIGTTVSTFVILLHTKTLFRFSCIEHWKWYDSPHSYGMTLANLPY